MFCAAMAASIETTTSRPCGASTGDQQIYTATNFILVALGVQLLGLFCVALPVLCALLRFNDADFFLDSFALNFGTTIAVIAALLSALVSSTWQFAVVLGIRSVSTVSIVHVNHQRSFLPVALVGIFASIQLLVVGGVLLNSMSFWEQPLRSNFQILMEASSFDPDAAKSFNWIQQEFDCCGSIVDSGNLSDRYTFLSGRFKPIAAALDNFFPLQLVSQLQETFSVPFSCCNRNAGEQCVHLDLGEILDESQRAPPTFPPTGYSRDQVLHSLSLNAACPDAVVSAIFWEYFVFGGISFVVAGAFVFCVSVGLFVAHWRLKRILHANGGGGSGDGPDSMEQNTVSLRHEMPPNPPTMQSGKANAKPKGQQLPTPIVAIVNDGAKTPMTGTGKDGVRES